MRGEDLLTLQFGTLEDYRDPDGWLEIEANFSQVMAAVDTSTWIDREQTLLKSGVSTFNAGWTWMTPDCWIEGERWTAVGKMRI